MSAAPSAIGKWTRRTWRDLERWAGARSVQRGRSYFHQGRVQNLRMTTDGRLLATVIGTKRYAVTVERRGGQRSYGAIDSQCICPVGERCKHAVATIAAVIEAVASGEEVEGASEDDPRWAILAGTDDDEELDDADDDEDDRSAFGRAATRPARRAARRPDIPEERVRAHLRGQGVEQLIEMIISLADRLPEARAALLDEVAARSGDAKRLIAEARREIRKVTSVVPWSNHWDGGGQRADYTRIKRLLGQLTEMGRANDVVALGRTLIARGLEQVSLARDEGETAIALSECAGIVFRSLKWSSLKPAEQILFAIDALTDDDYEVVAESAHQLLETHADPTEWSKVADALSERLGPPPTPHAVRALGERGSAASRDYRRDLLSGWLTEALQRAGRSNEVLDIYEREARATGNYPRLVEHLLHVGRTGDAQQWALEGIERTINQLPGIAFQLAERLREMARDRRDWPAVAAHEAYRFFDQPSLASFAALIDAADKAGCAAPVRDAALEFLGSGRCPLKATAGRGGARTRSSAGCWPLPTPDEIALLLRHRPILNRPRHDVLLERALADEDPEAVLHWYDRIFAAAGRSPNRWLAPSWDTQSRVAEAVADSHPQRALAIYEDRLTRSFGPANREAYQIAGDCLGRMRPLLRQLGREHEWHERVARLREQYRRRPRFIEVLDALESRPIMHTLKVNTARRKQS